MNKLVSKTKQLAIFSHTNSNILYCINVTHGTLKSFIKEFVTYY